MPSKTPKDILLLANAAQAVMVDLKFVDLLGRWQHLSVPVSMLQESSFQNGFGFDGSSICGFQAIENSDMLLVPDANTAVIDPFFENATLSLICNVVDPVNQQSYSRDPRYVARKAEDYLKSTGIADVAYFGPEAEFFVFDEVRCLQQSNEGFFRVDASEAHWNAGRNEHPNLGYKMRLKQGYFPVSPADALGDLRAEMCLEMQKVGIEIEAHHHEVGSAGQCEIDMRFNSLLNMADALMWFKYIVKNVAKRFGKTATFMPKPLYNDNGSGMHVHQSLWNKQQPLFAGNGYAGLSELAEYYLGGILKHAHALCAFTNPTTNSYRRLIRGFEAPVYLAYSGRNRSASIRIPMLSSSPAAKRLEVRFPDPSCNGYLAFAAMLMAGLDGIQKKIHPGKPCEKDIYALDAAEKAMVPAVPSSLDQSLGALEADPEFLLQGGVFTPDLLERYISEKREKELQELSRYPTPGEFLKYYDA